MGTNLAQINTVTHRKRLTLTGYDAPHRTVFSHITAKPQFTPAHVRLTQDNPLPLKTKHLLFLSLSGQPTTPATPSRT